MIRPLSDNVVVKRALPKKQSVGGIYLPDDPTKRTDRGLVVAVGPGRLLDTGTLAPMDLSPKDTILFNPYNGTEVEVEGEKLLIVSRRDILGVMS